MLRRTLSVIPPTGGESAAGCSWPWCLLPFSKFPCGWRVSMVRKLKSIALWCLIPLMFLVELLEWAYDNIRGSAE